VVAVRRWWTWLVVAAVAGIAATATADALRGGDESMPRVAAPTGIAAIRAREDDRAVSQLREAGVSGVLTYSDEDCRLHAITLPDLEPAHAPRFEMCEPFSGTGGIAAFDGDVVWSGLGYRTVQVVVSQEQLSRELRAPLGFDDGRHVGFRAVQAESLGDGRIVVLADSTYRPQERVLAVLQDHRVVAVQPRWVVGSARSVRPSPRGGYFALLGPDGVGVLDDRADPLDLPDGVQAPHAIAWSPDERWTAVATRASVYVFRTEETDGTLIRIPIAVRDLAWGAE
jgi:hypothetical protein